MASLQDVQHVKGLLGNIENILKHLAELEFASIDNLKLYLKKVKSLDTLYSNLVKFTHQGKFSPALRLRLKKLITWKKNLDSLLEEEVRMKKNKSSALEESETEKYVDYIEKIEYFIQNFPSQLKEIKVKIDSLFKKSTFLKDNLNKFQLQKSDIVNLDLLRAEDSNDEEININEPIRTLGVAKASINEFARVIKKIQNMSGQINSVIAETSEYPIEEVLSALNKKNVLVKNLFQLLTQLNKLFYASNFSSNLLLRQQYNELLIEVSKYLPPVLLSKFVLGPPPKSRIEEITDSSVGGLKQQMKQDKTVGIDTEVSPWQRVTINPNKPSAPSSPIPSGRYEEYIKSKKISPEEKSKYESLWKKD